MISSEPKIKVGIFEHRTEVRGVFNAKFLVAGVPASGEFHARVESDMIVLFNNENKAIAKAKEICCVGAASTTFTLHDVTIGISFHWERNENQTFQGDMLLVLRDDGTITAINEISVEEYLASVISSEMSAEAPSELLKAHAITSRSWLVAMLEREKKKSGSRLPQHGMKREIENHATVYGELIRWYDREDHDLFDVCADDHCQRYQGITKIISKSAGEAIESTRGMFILYNNEICDARFYKSCGGLSEDFQNAWEDVHVPYLTCVADSPVQYPHIKTEEDAERWMLSSPNAYCNTTDGNAASRNILRQILPSFDQETTDFFRWKVEYTREELSEIVRIKSGIDFGEITNLVPVQRGPSGRIIKLKIEGTKKTLIVGKELEIRRWLSKSHLYSSAFIVRKEADTFILIGAGWGHGVGLCQIGAAVMAAKGFKAEEIVKHYFRGVELRKLY
jgi:stage II sporulation protein D